MNKGLTLLFDKLSKTEKRYINHSFDSAKHKNLIALYADLSEGNKIKANGPAQHRLLEYILERLTQFHQAELIDQMLMTELSKARILYGKGLFELSKKYLSKAKKTARKHQRFLLYQQLIEFELFCFKDEGEVLQKARKLLKELRSEELEYQRKQQLATKGRFYAIDYLLISRNRISPMAKDLHNSYRDVIQELEKELTNNPPTEFFICYHNVQGMFAFSSSDFSKSCTHFMDTVQTIESTVKGSSVFSKEYFFALNNLLMTYGLTGKMEAYNTTLKKIKNVFSGQKKYDKDLFSTTLMYEVGFDTELGRYDRVVAHEAEILKGIRDFELNVINRQLYYINLAVSFLSLGDMNKANRYIITIITDTASKRVASNSNIYFYAHILSLVIQYEKEEFDYMQYAIQSTVTHLLRIRPMNAFDSRIIQLLKQLSSHPEKKKELCTELLEDPLLETTESAFAHQFFDFKTWLQSIIQRKTIFELRNGKPI